MSVLTRIITSTNLPMHKLLLLKTSTGKNLDWKITNQKADDAISYKIIFGTCLSTTYIQFSAIEIRHWLTLLMPDLTVLTAQPWLSPHS